jgi:glycosyltransferase involved in cell wall biosynthesis
MRLALVVTGGFDRSGRERVIPSLIWLVERLARVHDVFVYVLRYHDKACRYPLAGAVVRDLGSPRGPVRQAGALWHALREDGPFDVVHAYWAQPAGRVTAPIAALLGIPSIVTFDSGEFVSLPQAGYGLQSTLSGRLGVALTARLATRVTVCSEYQATLARAHGLHPCVIPLGVDSRLFSPRPAAPAFPPFRLLHVGSLNPVKDQTTLVRAVHLLAARNIDVTLDIAGEDTMGGRLQALVRQLQIESRIRFHGFLPSDRLLPLYYEAHAFVLSSLHEAAGVVLLEAASCGVPVVGSRVGYLADWSPDAATTVRPGSPEALAGAVEGLIAEPARRDAAAANAHEWARAHDADWTARHFDDLYQQLVSRKPRPRARQ